MFVVKLEACVRSCSLGPLLFLHKSYIENCGPDNGQNVSRVNEGIFQVLVNPFDDIVPRVVISQEMDKKDKKKKSKAKAHKAFNVLSFGAEAEEEEEELEAVVGGSKGKSKSDPKLVGADKHQLRDQLGQDASSSEEEDDVEDPAEVAEMKRLKAKVMKSILIVFYSILFRQIWTM